MVKKLVAGVLMGAMLFSLTGCGEKVKKYSPEKYQEIVADTLGIDEDEIHIRELDENTPGAPYKGTDVYYYGDENLSLLVSISEDDWAHNKFEELYDKATAEIEHPVFTEMFEGKYNIEYDGEVGYIVFSSAPGSMYTSLFGDANFFSLDFYGGYYYYDNMFLAIYTQGNHDEKTTEDVIRIIEALGYPTVEDK